MVYLKLFAMDFDHIFSLIVGFSTSGFWDGKWGKVEVLKVCGGS